MEAGEHTEGQNRGVKVESSCKAGGCDEATILAELKFIAVQVLDANGCDANDRRSGRS